MEEETIAIITTLSPVFQDLIFRRIRSVRFTQRNSRCSFCHVFGHHINICCHNHALAVLANMCMEIDDLLHMNIRGDEIQTILEAFLNMRSLNEVKLVVSLFDYATSYNKRQLNQILIREVLYMQTTAAIRHHHPHATQQPPPLRINIIYQMEEEEEEGNPSSADDVCPICIDTLQQNRVISTNCNHKLCTGCACQYIARNTHQRVVACPLCRGPIDKLYANSQESYQEVSRLF